MFNPTLNSMRPGVMSSHGICGERTCSCCGKRFTFTNRVQKSSARAYCKDKRCQYYKKNKVWSLSAERAKEVMAAYDKKPLKVS